MDETSDSAPRFASDPAPPGEGAGLAAHLNERFRFEEPEAARPLRRSWPWFVAAALLLHVLIAASLVLIERRPQARTPAPEAIAIEVIVPDAAEKKPAAASGKPEKPNPVVEQAKREPGEAKGQDPKSAPESKAQKTAQAKGEARKNQTAKAEAKTPKPRLDPAANAEATKPQAPPPVRPTADKTGAEFPPARSRVPFDLGPPIFQAVAVPLPVAGGDEPMNYKVIVFGMLERVKHFPEAAAARGARGACVIEFSLDESGGVESVALLRSSGDPDLDAESVAVVARAAPFPAPPAGGQRAFAAEITFGRPQ